LPDPQLVSRVEALGATSLEVVAFRHVSAAHDPLSGMGALLNGGRWNPPQSFATVYLGLDIETVVDEFHRMAARQGLTVDDFLPRRLYRVRVRLGSVLDLRAPEARAALSLTDSLLRGDDPSACQGIGEAADYLGREAIVAPSAAGPGTILAVFLSRLGAESSLDVVGYEVWEDASPRDTARPDE
jgi:RES domain-containing protein